MRQNKIYSLLGLAARGRNVVSGEFSTENAIRNSSAVLVIVAKDASDNTKKLFNDKCSFYHVPVYTYGTKVELGQAMGKGERSSLALINEGLAQTITKHLEEIEN